MMIKVATAWSRCFTASAAAAICLLTSCGGDSFISPTPVMPWVWENPASQGNTLNSICGTTRNDLLAVGHGGTVMRYDGIRWTPSASGVTADGGDLAVDFDLPEARA